MNDRGILLITGSSKGIGRHLAAYYAGKGYHVIGCSRSPAEFSTEGYEHFCLDITDEAAVLGLFAKIRTNHGGLDVLINNAGIASMNHAMLTPMRTAERVMRTNFLGTFVFCREAAKLMQKRRKGRIVNFTTVAVPLKLAGEAIYASSKAAVITLTEILAAELAPMNITVNAIGPTPIRTDLIRAVPEEKLQALLERQSIKRFGEFRDVVNVVDFFIQDESDFVSGQTIFLGGV